MAQTDKIQRPTENENTDVACSKSIGFISIEGQMTAQNMNDLQ